MKLGGPLALGLGGMLGVSVLSMLNPFSRALTNVWLYGGLGLFGTFLLYDTQVILARAKTEFKFDPISNSLQIYLDALNVFIRLTSVFG